ncbi:hypothetical protein JOD29_003411 [Lysinibacillus composti]|uniref:DUF5011 domain-containing protein n=1 Tax=Lysinibacillus composti TaxID=720633 RepID=A0A3N9U9H5_9BACI|nr:hypothetical protein [Lysinibacillus composti]MBM7610132.1 hypothetical protein [Lysinibacillus composti]RQW73220.1 hypothetical protein EBB45_17825 [Lysinibacillus composti]
MKKVLASILSILFIVTTGFIDVQAEEERKPIELSYEIWDNDGPINEESFIVDPYLQEKKKIWQGYDLPEDRYMVVIVRNEINHPYFETYQARDNMYSWDSHNKFKTIEEAEAWGYRLSGIQVKEWNEYVQKWGYTNAEGTGYTMVFVEPNEFKNILIKDKTAPVTSSSNVPANWTNKDVYITLTAFDEESGIDKTEYRINEGDWIQYTGPIDSFSEGKNLIEYRSIDRAGNMEETKSAEVKIDKTAPSLNVSFNQSVITDSNHKLTPINALIVADDSLSGVASYELVSILSNQSDNGKGDGNTAQDIQGAEFGTSDVNFLLRSERSGHGNRIYTIIYKATDNAGNSVITSQNIVVKHDNSIK